MQRTSILPWPHRLATLFVRAAGLFLLLTALAKLFSVAGKAQILELADPVTGISFRKLLLVVGLLELGVGFVCVTGKQIGVSAGLLAWVSTNFAAYRLALRQVGYHKPCSCLGNLTDSLHIPPETADLVMKIGLSILFVGSYVTLLWFRHQRTKVQLEPGLANSMPV